MAREDGPVLGHAESLRRIKQQGTRKVSTCADVVVNARNVGAGECCESLAVGSEQWDCDVTDAFGMLAIALPIAVCTHAIQSRFQFLLGDGCFSF